MVFSRLEPFLSNFIRSCNDVILCLESNLTVVSFYKELIERRLSFNFGQRYNLWLPFNIVLLYICMYPRLTRWNVQVSEYYSLRKPTKRTYQVFPLDISIKLVENWLTWPSAQYNYLCQEWFQYYFVFRSNKNCQTLENMENICMLCNWNYRVC